MPREDTIRLQSFIDTSKSKGAEDEFLAALLTRSGWPAGDVYAALGHYWESTTGLAIPKRAGAGESARDAFDSAPNSVQIARTLVPWSRIDR